MHVCWLVSRVTYIAAGQITSGVMAAKLLSADRLTIGIYNHIAINLYNTA